ncbi:hypothetical protein WFH67_21585 [Vibrio vulnificus]|uniref:hypothetical protein n=1 Tax=Vibrio vulnificus TaxID=672 RepID=UPI001A2609A5|nr:hypothetical protein [Vibrio vulnificus]EIX4876400.1 hypothetical protein [Vibrio vulnificus]ELO5516953.1 hypothetical protein [Vibrio vulnificus]MCU8361220.1 hypothetical protein [Vibrio vulnificus]HAS8313168.1 hypothetical protein [Vibrio vulnificus]
MNKNRLFELYEKTYFHEMEVREKLVGRVQINFALVATGFAVLSYMVRMLDFSSNHVVLGLFILSVLFSIGLAGFCVYHLVKAFWGNEYKGIPTGLDIDNYRDQMVVYKSQIEVFNKENPDESVPDVDVDTRVYDYVYSKFRDCSSHNTKVNDLRSAHIHDSFRWLLRTAIPFIFASFFFIAGDLDVSSPRKETPILNKSLNESLEKITHLLEQSKNSVINDKEDSMSKHQTNPQPPPPPTEPPPRKVIQNDNPPKQM